LSISLQVPKQPHLPHSFAKELKQLNDVTDSTFSPYGRLVHDFTVHNEQPGEMPWPGMEAENGSSSGVGEGMAGTLCQEFVVSWKAAGGTESSGFLELEFEGLSGSFAGEKGRPGVEYSPELGSYRANVSPSKIQLPAQSNCVHSSCNAVVDGPSGRHFLFATGQF
jgi:hypothetical protein